MKRLKQLTLVLTVIAFSWLAMQVVHESGHVLGAMLTGGHVDRVILHPLVMSRTDLARNPHPLFVVWAGPVVGSLLPLLAFLIAMRAKVPELFLLQFFAGFCLIANGVYIGVGSFEELADAGDMLMRGSSQWQLILFGLLTAPLGLYMWNGLGTDFGLGKAKGQVSTRATLISTSLLLVLVTLELVFSTPT